MEGLSTRSVHCLRVSWRLLSNRRWHPQCRTWPTWKGKRHWIEQKRLCDNTSISACVWCIMWGRAYMYKKCSIYVFLLEPSWIAGKYPWNNLGALCFYCLLWHRGTCWIWSVWGRYWGYFVLLTLLLGSLQDGMFQCLSKPLQDSMPFGWVRKKVLASTALKPQFASFRPPVLTFVVMMLSGQGFEITAWWQAFGNGI